MKNKAIYKFTLDGGRMGTLEWLFVEDPSRIAKNANREIYLTDVLGKHSEFIIPLNKDYIQLITRDQQFIDRAETLGALTVGNPLDYLTEEED